MRPGAVLNYEAELAAPAYRLEPGEWATVYAALRLMRQGMERHCRRAPAYRPLLQPTMAQLESVERELCRQSGQQHTPLR